MRHFIKAVKEGTSITSALDAAPKKKGELSIRLFAIEASSVADKLFRGPTGSAVLRVNLGSTHGPSIELNDVA